MSGKVVGWAMEQQTGSPTTKLVLVKLADNANEQGYCFPSVGLIVTHTELSDKAVRIHLRNLEDLGLIKVIREKVGNAHLQNQYQLNVPWVRKEIPGGGKRDHRRTPPARDAIPPMAEQTPALADTLNPLASDTTPLRHDVPSHIEEPSIEPSSNPHNARAGALTRYGDEFEHFIQAGEWSGGISLALAHEAWLAALADESLTAGALTECARLDRARQKAQSTAERRRVPFCHPQKWLAEKRYESFLPNVLADAGEREEICGAKSRLIAAFGAEKCEVLAVLNGREREFMGLVAKSEIIVGSPVRWVVPDLFARARLLDAFEPTIKKLCGQDVRVDLQAETQK
ncbi:MAG TPA: helix-turn-helix domain-containing protein [Rhizomicrobium sp.]